MKWTTNRIVSLVIGILFLLIGLVGFITPTENSTGVRAVFGIFDTDTLHSIIYVITGLLGVIASFTGYERTFNRVFGIVYLAIGILGLLPPLYFPAGSFGDDKGLFLGLTHINVFDHILHFVTAIAALYAAYAARDMVAVTASDSGSREKIMP